ncbi:MAG: hypothetical protein IIW01_01595 [Thermoguttaceae bacterium]|nr:hypothetical protein [Thermoguttaceae bacterium]MBQ5788958.1 hypothetical protein [Thermoguttaceae bacterium]
MNIVFKNATVNVYNLSGATLEDVFDDDFEEVDAYETDDEVGDEPEETARCNAEIYADADARPVFAAEAASDGR